jgi:hypothetical protein
MYSGKNGESEGQTTTSVKDSIVRMLLLDKYVTKRDMSLSLGPHVYVAVLVIPPLCHYLLSPWWYGPPILLAIAYMQIKKNRSDRALALNISTCPVLMGAVLSQLPEWVDDRDEEKLEWLNALVSKLWSKISAATELTLKEKLQPILDKHSPNLLKLSLTHVSLGHIAPKVNYVRVEKSSQDSANVLSR